MSKTIKIIDLFLKIANNEELPRKIKFEGCIYKLMPTINYYCEETKIFWLDILYGASLNNSLNYEVEIIEEQEEIDIQEINLDFARLGQFSIKNAKGQEEILEVLFIEVQEKMKELARKINYLDKNIKEK